MPSFHFITLLSADVRFPLYVPVAARQKVMKVMMGASEDTIISVVGFIGSMVLVCATRIGREEGKRKRIDAVVVSDPRPASSPRCNTYMTSTATTSRTTMDNTSTTTELTSITKTTTTTSTQDLTTTHTQTAAGEYQKTQTFPSPPKSDDEYNRWLSIFQNGRRGWRDLQHAPYHIRNAKDIVLSAVQNDSRAMEFAAPELWNDMDFTVRATIIISTPKQMGCNPSWTSYYDTRRRRRSKAEPAIISGPHISRDENDPKTTTQVQTLTTTTIPNPDETDRMIHNKLFWLCQVNTEPDWALCYFPPHIGEEVDSIGDEGGMDDSSYGSYEEKNRGFDENGWLSRIGAVGWDPVDLRKATSAICDNRKVMVAAVQKNASALKYASRGLQDDEDVVRDAVKNSRDGSAIKFASPRLQKNTDLVIAAVRNSCHALKFVLPDLKNNKRVIIAAVQHSRDGSALKFASPRLRNDKSVILAAVQHDIFGDALQYALPQIRNDKEVALNAIKKNPDAIKYVHESLKHDPEILIAAGMFDEDHDNAVVRLERKDILRKVAFSTRFALTPSSKSHATKFTTRFKSSAYIQMEGNFVVYTPNAFDKRTCDPAWTNPKHPCRGTNDTCEYNNVLTDAGHPTNKCCWRYSFRSQLEEAKDTNGFMLQLVETMKDFGKVDDAILGMGQAIELEMAKDVGTKVFQVYVPKNRNGYEVGFEDRHIDVVTAGISQWYNNHCQDMSVTIIHQQFV